MTWGDYDWVIFPVANMNITSIEKDANDGQVSQFSQELIID